MLAFRMYSVQTRGQHSAMSDALSIRPGPLVLRVFHPGPYETKHCLQAHQLKQVSGMKEEPTGLCVGSTAVLDITG